MKLPKKIIFSRILACGITLVTLAIIGFSIYEAVRWAEEPFPGFFINKRMIVGNSGQHYGTGAQAGLRALDKIMRVNGIDVASPRELNDVTRHAVVGEKIRYTVRENGKIVEINVPIMRFGWPDFIIEFGIPLLVGLLYLLFGGIVYFLKPDTKVSWIFLSACLLLSIHLITVFDVWSTYRFVSLHIIVTVFLPAVALHLGLHFPEPRKVVIRFPFLQWIPYFFSAILAITLERSYPGPLYVKLYDLVPVYLVLTTGTLVIFILFSFFKSSSDLARHRARVIFWGALFAFPLPALAFLMSMMEISMMGRQVTTEFSFIPVLIFPATIAYAIVKHNLFDVDVYIKRAVGYVLMTALVALTYFFLQTVIGTVVLQPLLGENATKLYPLLFALLIVFFFNPVNRRVQDAVDRMFFRKKTDYRKMVASVSNALTSLLNHREIITRIIDTVRGGMFVNTAGVILLEPRKKVQTFFIGDGPGNVKNQIKDFSISYDDPLLSLIYREKKLITKYDIAEAPQYADLRETCGQRFSEMDASLAVPLIYQNEVKGVLAIGHKKSGHFYTTEDIDLFQTLANQGAVAIENANLAEQMRKEETVRTNLARYLSPQIVDQIIQKDVQVNLGGDRKVVTVLFSDIRNFTTITETRPPDQLVQILNEYFTEMAGIIFENQGSLDKYIGDAIVAVFGSLIPLKNSARHAATAAIQMMKRLPALNERWMKEYGFSMNIGIGINTGEVFLGNIGSPDRMEFTVIGDTVNVASRFSGLAKPGQILVTRETLDCLKPDIPCRELPPTEVKGKTGKLDVFEIPYE